MCGVSGEARQQKAWMKPHPFLEGRKIGSAAGISDEHGCILYLFESVFQENFDEFGSEIRYLLLPILLFAGLFSQLNSSRFSQSCPSNFLCRSLKVMRDRIISPEL